MTDRNLSTAPVRRTLGVVSVLLALLFLVGGGYWWVQWQASIADRTLRQEMLDQAIALARTINTEHVKTFSFTDADQYSPEFQQLRQKLMGYQTITPYRGIYTVALHNGELVHGTQSYAGDDPRSSLPGTLKPQPTGAIPDVFQTGRAFVHGPYTKEYGTFVSAFAPVPDPRTGGASGHYCCSANCH